MALMLAFIFACNVYVFPGGIFDQNSELNKEILSFAVEKANEKILNNSQIQLVALDPPSQPIEYGNEVDAAVAVCQLINVRVWNRL